MFSSFDSGNDDSIMLPEITYAKKVSDSVRVGYIATEMFFNFGLEIKSEKSSRLAYHK